MWPSQGFSEDVPTLHTCSREWRLPALCRAVPAPQMMEGLFSALLLCSAGGLSNLDPDSDLESPFWVPPGSFLSFLKAPHLPTMPASSPIPFFALLFFFVTSRSSPHHAKWYHISTCSVFIFFFPQVLFLSSLGGNVGSLRAPYTHEERCPETG